MVETSNCRPRAAETGHGPRSEASGIERAQGCLLDLGLSPRGKALIEPRSNPLIKVLIYERLIFPEFCERLPFVAEHNEIPDDIACRFAHGLFAFPEEKTTKRSP
jgi:hypothetical protein